MPDILPLMTHASLHQSLGEQVHSCRTSSIVYQTFPEHVLCAQHTRRLVDSIYTWHYQRPSCHVWLLSMLQTHIPICLLGISPLISHKHMKLSTPRSEFISLLLNLPLLPLLPQLQAWPLHPPEVHNIRSLSLRLTCNPPVRATNSAAFSTNHLLPAPTQG